MGAKKSNRIIIGLPQVECAKKGNPFSRGRLVAKCRKRFGGKYPIQVIDAEGMTIICGNLSWWKSEQCKEREKA